MTERLNVRLLISAVVMSLAVASCASQNGDAARLAADSCASDPFLPVSDANQFIAGPIEIFGGNPERPDSWLLRAKQRAQLAARAAASDAYWQPLADSWGIAEAAARVAEQLADTATAADLRLSYAMVTKDAYCRVALVRIGTKLSPSQ
jgi:hypothetical protein